MLKIRGDLFARRLVISIFKGRQLCNLKTTETESRFEIQDRPGNLALKGCSMELHNIGIALSGGGIRATIFHLGLFKWLAEKGLLEEVKRISSVSGASLCVGLIYSHNNLTWPSSKTFLSNVLPSIERVILANDIQISAVLRLI